jgi:hypothetical protein
MYFIYKNVHFIDKMFFYFLLIFYFWIVKV